MIFKTGGRQPDLVTGGFDAFVFRHREATKTSSPALRAAGARTLRYSQIMLSYPSLSVLQDIEHLPL